MKKFLCIILAVFIPFAFCCCTHNISTGNNELSIVAVSFPEYDFVRAVAGDLADITMLIPPASETHGYEPTVSDIRTVGECDLFICTGGESDTWVKDILKSVNNPDIKTLALTESVNELCEEDHDHQHDHADESKYTFDEHVWTSPVNAISIVNKVCDALCDIDTNNSEVFKTNTKAYIEKLYALDKEIRDVTETAENNTLVFGDRFPLLYFAEEYELGYLSAFSGCSDDTEASAATVASLIDYVKDEKIPVVFINELSNTAIADQIAKETGAEVMTFYSCHKVSKDDFESGKTYIDIMSRNIDSLKTALN